MGKINPEIIRIVKAFKARTARKYHIRKMILFGSQASGTATAGSDIDLIVVTNKKDNGIVMKLAEEWHIKQDIDYPVDFIDYTYAEFKRLSGSISMVRQALETGMEV